MNELVIDFHIHLAPGLEAVASEPRTRYAYGIPVQTEHALLGDVDALLRVVDAAGIDVAVLSSGRGLRGDLAQARVANEGLARICEQHGERLRFLAHVADPTADGWLAEVERWLDACPGAAAPSAFPGARLDDPRLDALYELLARRDRFLWIHPALDPDQRDAEVYDAFDLYRTVGREFSLVLALLRLVLSGVLDRHPALTVIVSHLGGGIASVVPRVSHYQDKAFWGLAGDPVHGRTSLRPFEDYLGSMYYDTGGFFGDARALDAALVCLPRDRILLGTDYPQETRDPAQVRRAVEALEARGLGGAGAGLLA